MASRGNPNVPSKFKRKAHRSKVQKRYSGKISKNRRETALSSVLRPTNGPATSTSSKKARKLARAQNHARRRALEEAMAKEGEVVMTDAPKTTKAKFRTEDEKMELDNII